MIKLKEILHPSLQQEFVEGFDMEVFNNLRSFQKRIVYCREHLTRLTKSPGSSRIVYKIDDTKVLKLAKNKKGIAQNDIEADWGLNNMYEEIIAGVLDDDEEYNRRINNIRKDGNEWIVSKFAKKVTPERFKQLLGIDFESFYAYLYGIVKHRSTPGVKKAEINPDVATILDNSDFFYKISDLIGNFDIRVEDFGILTAYGEIDGELVLVDYGLTEDVWKTHYTRKKI